MSELTTKITGIPLFDGTNFNNWRFRVEMALDEKNLSEYIKKDYLTLLAAATNQKDQERVTANEKKCKNIIVQSVHDCQLENIKDKDTAKAMVDGLTNIYERKSISTKLLLKRELLLMKYQKSDDMKDHLVKFDTKIRELKSAGAKMEEEDIVVHLLLTLPDTYDNLITAIGTMDQNKVTLEIVKSHVLDEYNKKSAGTSIGKSSSSSAMNANITCFGCGQVGHIKSQCKSKKKKHFNKKSSSKKSDSEKNSANATVSSESAASMSAVCEIIHNENGTVNETVMHTIGTDKNKATTKQSDDSSHIKFILDSGATEHMANNESFFYELCDTNNINISVAKRNSSISANQKGDIHVKLFQSGDCEKKTIRDVLYVKDLKCNLMSIRSLTKHGYRIVFEGDVAEVSKDGKKIFVAQSQNKLYEVKFQKILRE